MILGTVQLGLDYGINNQSGKPSRVQAKQILDYAYSSGIKTLDTAAGYGNSEEIIGLFHKVNPSREFGIITKFHFNESSNLSKVISQSLEKLKISRIETLMFHSFAQYEQYGKLILNEWQLNHKDSVKQFGVSVYNNEEIEELLEDDDISVIQLPFNLFDNGTQRANVLKNAKQKGKIIHVRSLFLQGLFFMDTKRLPQKLTPLMQDLLKLNEIAIKWGYTKEYLALNYAKSRPYIDEIVVGVESFEQLKSNILNLSNDFSLEIVNEIEKIQVKEKQLLNPSNWNK